MPAARTCSLAAHQRLTSGSLPPPLGAPTPAEPPQGPEPRVPGRGAQVSGRSGGHGGVGEGKGKEEKKNKGTERLAQGGKVAAERCLGSATWPRVAPGTLRALGCSGRLPPGEQRALSGPLVPPPHAEVGDVPGNSAISPTEINDRFAAAGILEAAWCVSGNPRPLFP